MEESCWSCGGSHHRRECTAEEVVGVKRDIQKVRCLRPEDGARKQMKQGVQLEKMQEKRKIKFSSPPPLDLVKKELGRVEDVFVDFLLELEHSPNFLANKNHLTAMQRKLSETMDSIRIDYDAVRFLGAKVASCRIFLKSSDELQDISWRMEFVREMQQKCNDLLYVGMVNCKIGLELMELIEDIERKSEMLTSELGESFNGRPLNLRSLKEDEHEIKKLFMALQVKEERFHYVFAIEERNKLKSRIQDLENNLTTLSALLDTKPNETKFSCKICYANDIEVAFDCGHVFCTNCSVDLSVCPNCRKRILKKIKLYLD